MAQKKMYPGLVNSPATELAADITATQTTIAVLSVAGLLAPEGITTIGGGDSAETITYTSISGTTLQGVTRGFQSTARAWTAGVRVSRNFTAYDYDTTRLNIMDLDSAKLALSGGDMTGAIGRKYASTLKTYKNLAGYTFSGGISGALKIMLPKGFVGSFIQLQISGFDYAAAKGAWRLRIGGNASASSGGGFFGINTAILEGEAPFNTVTLGYDGTNVCVLLGGVTTPWSYPAVTVEEFTASTAAVDGYEAAGWSMSMITDISGITKAVQPVLQKLATQAYADAAIATHNADYVRQPGYTPVTRNSSDVYTGALSPAPLDPAVLPDGFGVTIVPDAANTTATPRLQLNGGATIQIRRTPTTDFAVGAIKAGVPLALIKVGSYFLARSVGATGTATAAQVRAGATFSNESNVDLVGTLPVQATAAQTVTPGTTDQVKAAGIYDGAITIKGDVNLVADNILAGKSIFGVSGNQAAAPTMTVGTTTVGSPTGATYSVYNVAGDASYQKRASVKVKYGGTYRVSFSLYGDGTYNTTGRIYVNGVGRGIERTQYSSSKMTYTEDFTVQAGDTIELWFKRQSVSTNGGAWENFSVGYTAPVIAEYTLGP